MYQSKQNRNWNLLDPSSFASIFILLFIFIVGIQFLKFYIWTVWFNLSSHNSSQSLKIVTDGSELRRPNLRNSPEENKTVKVTLPQCINSGDLRFHSWNFLYEVNAITALGQRQGDRLFIHPQKKRKILGMFIYPV